MEFPGLVNAVVATFVELSLVAAVVAVAAPRAGAAKDVMSVLAPEAAATRLVLASAAVEAPVPPSATARSVIPAMVPPVIATLGIVCVPVKVGLARGALRARAVTSASERGKEAKVALFVTPASTNGIVSVESGLATVVSSEILGI
jgi:hypothetical protein